MPNGEAVSVSSQGGMASIAQRAATRSRRIIDMLTVEITTNESLAYCDAHVNDQDAISVSHYSMKKVRS